MQTRMIVAIIGHRDLSPLHVARYRLQCKEALQALQRRHPRRTLEVMSTLAPGAERIGAEVSLSLGLRLIVLLPPDLVTDPTESPQSLAEYRDLLLQIPIQNFQIPAPDTHGDDSARTSAGLTRLIVMESQVLLAMWDGEKSRTPGDTAELIDIKRRPAAHDLAESIDGPVLHIRAICSASHQPQAFSVPEWLYPYDTLAPVTIERRKRNSVVV